MLGRRHTQPDMAAIEREERRIRHFAQGLNFYKLFWIFFIGSFLGVVVETIWCILTRGQYESRVGLLFGPFNLVYGFGALALAIGLYWLRTKRDALILLGGAVIGSGVEYVCSWVQERMFGSHSWDYSQMPLNVNGRISLLYSLFWGFLAIWWVKDIFPLLSRWILKIPNRVGKPLTWALCLFMLVNTVMSGYAVTRWVERQQDLPATDEMEEWMDAHYPDNRMKKIYANMEFIVEDEA